MRINKLSKKVNYKFGVKGQEKVTWDQNINFHSIHSKYYLSERKCQMIVRISQKIPCINVHIAIFSTKSDMSNKVTIGH